MSKFLTESIFCPLCQNCPLLYLSKNKPKEVLIICSHCELNEFFSLHNYLNEITKNIKKKNNNEKYCNNHHQICNIYCIKCNLYCCNKCQINNHQSHKIISFDNIISTNLFYSKINEGYYHINNYSNQLKREKIQKYITKIN